jgi:hypothetical protein
VIEERNRCTGQPLFAHPRHVRDRVIRRADAEFERLGRNSGLLAREAFIPGYINWINCAFRYAVSGK